jgi:hypothetical protein
MNVEEIIKAIAALDNTERFELAWKVMDLANLVPIVILDLDDIKEELEDNEETYTDEQILAAMKEISENDWSHSAAEAADEVLDILRNPEHGAIKTAEREIFPPDAE